MFVWDVLGKRSDVDEFTAVGGVKAPDAEMALLLARETHFRHKEGVAYAVRRRGEAELHVGSYGAELIGGITDRSYRRQEGYTGVGAKHRRVSEQMAGRGLVVDHPRPSPGRARALAREQAESHGAEDGSVPSGADLTPEDLAAQGTAG
jgi:1,2-phenylacetyl-CoA epoxidase PaaB subunit